MTRVLSELLEAEEPYFQQSLRQLESLAGHPRTDIRLSAEIQHSMRDKIRELGLDGHDTTTPELYAVLGERLKGDEARFRASIGIGVEGDSDETEVMLQVLRAVKAAVSPRTAFALKSAVAKRLLKVQVPRKTMKQLGYRSADSMFKQETAAALFAAAAMIESEAWHRRLYASFQKLKATDFELRDIAFEHPASKRWQELAESVVAQRKQFVLSFKELGAVVVLPLPAQRPEMSALTTAVLVLHAVNEIRAASTYLRLNQMNAGFGAVVRQVVSGEQLVSAEALGRPLSWETLHQFFGRLQRTAQAQMFEPMLAAEELTWTSVEHTLARIEPSLEFWLHTAHLGLRDLQGRIASCNMTDVLLSHANSLSSNQHTTRYFKQALHGELLLRYLADDKPRHTLLNNLQMKLAPEMATM